MLKCLISVSIEMHRSDTPDQYWDKSTDNVISRQYQQEVEVSESLTTDQYMISLCPNEIKLFLT